jgi:hypothetical protein
LGTVTNLNSSKDIEEFCDFLYGVETGFVYLPTKDPDSTSWFETWFEWPRQRSSVHNHIHTLSKTREVYIGPVIYSEPTLNAAYVRGSSVVWCEFDGKVPNAETLDKKGSPPPTYRVRSSKAGHEHWYWKLSKFELDLKSIQDTNKALAYGLGADPSGWDITQVLRPVGSFNHKRDMLPVTVVSNSLKFVSMGDFSSLPSVEENYSETDFDSHAIPKADIVLLKYAWTSTEQELIRAPAYEGQRSSMLTKLGYMCCEKGLDNSEIYAVLEFADSRWLKFYNRTNRKNCYIKLIDYIRQKHPYTTESTTSTETKFKYRIQGFMTHFKNTDRLEWIIPGLLHDSASMFIVGKAGSLKTAFATEIGINLALNRSMLSWQNLAERPLKLIMWSLEMSGPEVVERQETIVPRYAEDKLDMLEDNFKIYSDPEPMRLFDPVEALAFKEAILDTKPDGIILDSASMAYSPNMSDEENVKKSVRFMQNLRHAHKFFSIIIHHPRKDLAGVKSQRMSLNDLFGSQTLENSASTVIGMAKREKKEDEAQKIDLIHLKTRFAEVPADYVIELDKTDFTFSRPVISLGGNNEDLLINKMADDMMRKPKRGDADGPGLSF